MKIAVAGASGFLGSRLSRRLSDARHEVLSISRRSGPRSWRETFSGADLVFHAAGLKTTACDADIAAAVEANVDLTKALLDAAASARVRKFIFLSSYFVYGRQNGLPCVEEAELHPVDAYGMTKALAEMAVRQSGLEHAILRVGNIFGFDPAGAGREVVYAMTESAFREGVVSVIGEGRQTLDLLPADSFCAIVELLCRNPLAQGTMNVASGRPVAVKDLAAIVADAVQKISGKPVRVAHKPSAETDPISRAVTVERLERLIGPLPAPTLEESVRSFVSAYAGCPVP